MPPHHGPAQSSTLSLLQKAVPLLVDRDGAQLTDGSAYHHGQSLGLVTTGGEAVSDKVDSVSVSKRRVLVIGGSGFMGRATVQLLQAEVPQRCFKATYLTADTAGSSAHCAEPRLN